jgi:dUTP pyrophosphatase
MTEFNLCEPPINQTHNQILNLDTQRLLNTYDKYMYLKIFINDINDNNELKQKYIDSALNHNNKILNPNNPYLDAGFDLFNPTRNEILENNQPLCSSFSGNRMSVINKVNFGIICSAQMITDNMNKVYNTGYYTHPRSSLSKTKLRLANSTGIIDSGYRGELIGMFDLINLSPNEKYVIGKYDRLLQICAPGLVPIVVEIVNTFEELGNETERGAGGFGSTGI